MNTITFRELLHSTAARLDMLPADLDDKDGRPKMMLGDYANAAMKLAWEFYDWPDAMRWSEETLVTHPTLETTYIPRYNAARELKVVRSIFDGDPRVGAWACKVEGVVREPDGFYFPGQNRSTVWMNYRPNPPKFSVIPFDADQDYKAGSRVWDVSGDDDMEGSGDVYRALVQTGTSSSLDDTAKWIIEPVLACLAEPVKAGIIGAYHAAGGSHGTARVKEDYMREMLEHEIEQLSGQEGQSKFY